MPAYSRVILVNTLTRRCFSNLGYNYSKLFQKKSRQLYDGDDRMAFAD